MKKTLLMLCVFILVNSGVMAQNYYEVPPSSSTFGNAPYISDEAMEQCVILYNKAKDLNNTLDSMHVDRYNASSVNNYNTLVDEHSEMISKFNNECAGKQSESAYRAAQKLNEGRVFSKNQTLPHKER